MHYLGQYYQYCRFSLYFGPKLSHLAHLRHWGPQMSSYGLDNVYNWKHRGLKPFSGLWAQNAFFQSILSIFHFSLNFRPKLSPNWVHRRLWGLEMSCYAHDNVYNWKYYGLKPRSGVQALKTHHLGQQCQLSLDPWVSALN